jgi:hypothetical protein
MNLPELLPPPTLPGGPFTQLGQWLLDLYTWAKAVEELLEKTERKVDGVISHEIEEADLYEAYPNVSHPVVVRELLEALANSHIEYRDNLH